MYQGSHSRRKKHSRIRMNKLAILFIAVVMLIGAALRLVGRGGMERIKCANCRKQRWGKRYAVKEVKHG